MLDQSFSQENFRILIDVENRKGRYIEKNNFFKGSNIFAPSNKENDKLVEINGEIRNEEQRLKKIITKVDSDYECLNTLNATKETIKKERELILEKLLTQISENVNSDLYNIKIEKGQIKFGSQLYNIEKTPEHYFVLKQLQRNIYKTFKVKQSQRKSILSQLILHMNDGFPKVIVRTDIKSFYESIPHKELLSKIEENSLLSSPSKEVIKHILKQYWNILIADGVKSKLDERVGVPRGVGISAYLSELYMRDFDRKMTSYEDVIYYARYVDDIIVIFSPKVRTENKTSLTYKNIIKTVVNSSTKLSINEKKTDILDLRKENKERKISQKYRLTYLGYKLTLPYTKIKHTFSKKPLIISMSDNKLDRYKNKIRTAFEDYDLMCKKFPTSQNGINRMLLKRIRFLTNNFQLLRRKSNVYVGIYFSNEFINIDDDFTTLDKILNSEIIKATTAENQKLMNKLIELSFTIGFRDRKFQKFNHEAFENKKVLGIWKNL